MSEPRYWDDYEVGQKFPLGSTSFTEQEIVDFARQFDPQPFHIDPEAAKKSMYGGIIASGRPTEAIAAAEALRDCARAGGTECAVSAIGPFLVSPK